MTFQGVIPRGEALPVTFRPEMFSVRTERYAMPEGLSLAEIAANVPNLPVEFWVYGVITVGGEFVPQEWWARVRPRIPEGATEVAITLSMVPLGSGSKGKSIGLIVGAVALLAATAFIGAGGLAPLLGAGFAAGTWGATAAAAGVSLVGGLALAALAPPPIAANRPSIETRRDKPTAGVSGNPLRPLELVSGLVGTMIASPPVLAPPYTSFLNGVVTAHIVVGFAGRHTIDDVRINDTLETDMQGVTVQTREGDPGDTVLTICDKTVIEAVAQPTRMPEFDLKDQGDLDRLENQATPASSNPDWVSFTTRGTPDEVWTRWLFPQGLIQTDPDTGDTDEAIVPVRVRFRLRGSATWINGPEFHFWDDQNLFRQIRQKIYFVFQAGGGVLTSFDRPKVAQAYWNAAPGQTWEWEAHSYFNPGSGLFATHIATDKDGFTVYLDPTIFPPGTYEFQFKRGLAFRLNDWDEDTYIYDGTAAQANFFDHYTDGGIHRVRSPQETFTASLALESFQSYIDEYPFAAPSDMPVAMSLIAVEARHIQIQSISALFSSVINTWDGTDWDTVAASNNPAAILRHIWKDDLNARPLNSAIIDDDNLADWYEHCEDMEYACNAIVSDSIEAVSQMVAAAGWAVPRRNEKWGVIVEHDRSGEAIVQNFTPLNIRGLTNSKPFINVPHAIWAEFFDEGDDYTLKTEAVYGDGYDAGTATTFESIHYDGITSSEQVLLRAELDWRQGRYRQTQRSFEIAAEMLVSARGDLVGLTHDVVLEYAWWGRVEQVFTSGGNVTAVRLRSPVTLSETTGPFGAAIRYTNGTVVTKQIVETTDVDTITFSTPFADPGATVLAPGVLVGVGVLAEEYKRQIIFDIMPGPDFTARVTTVDEAPEIHADVAMVLLDTGGGGLLDLGDGDVLRVS